MKNLLVRFNEDQSGATAIEYGLIATGIAIVIFGATEQVGAALIAMFENIAANLTVS